MGMIVDGLLTTFYVYVIGAFFVAVEFYRDLMASAVFIPAAINRTEFRRKIGRDPVAVVTGADGAIGRRLINNFLELDFIVCAVGRSNPVEHPNVHFYETDLANQSQVEKTGEAIADRFYDGIHVLVCNAAVMLHPFKLTKQGREMHLDVNVFSHITLFNKLEKALAEAPLSRVLFVSSATCRAGHLDERKALTTDLWQQYMNGYQAYADSKLFVNLFVDRVSVRMLEALPNTVFISAHPGVIATPLYRHANIVVQKGLIVTAKLLRCPDTAAAGLMNLIFSDHLQRGAYYEDGRPVAVLESMSLPLRDHYYKRMLSEISGF